jgi:hypothetical protein
MASGMSASTLAIRSASSSPTDGERYRHYPLLYRVIAHNDDFLAVVTGVNAFVGQEVKHGLIRSDLPSASRIGG